jgi:hypothetical protein
MPWKAQVWNLSKKMAAAPASGCAKANTTNDRGVL